MASCLGFFSLRLHLISPTLISPTLGSHFAYILCHFTYTTKSFNVHIWPIFFYRCTYKVAESRQIICQANCGVFKPRIIVSILLSISTHRFLRRRLRPPVASCRIVMWVLASSCWKVRISSNRLGFFQFTTYLNPLRTRAGAPLVVVVNSIMAG